jgi:hypothetical protein
MNTLKTYSKTGLRFAILTVLGMALMIVAKPQNAAAATAACLQACEAALQACDLACGNPPRISLSCTPACGTKFGICKASCN